MLHLRPLQNRDAQALAGWGQDEVFGRQAGWTGTSPDALHDFWVRQVEEPPVESIRVAVEDADGEVAGHVDLHGLTAGEKELGFLVGPSCRWRCGLGRRVAEAEFTYSFNQLALRRDEWMSGAER